MPLAVPHAAAAFMWASMFVPNETGTVNLIVSLVGIEPLNWTMRFPLIRHHTGHGVEWHGIRICPVHRRVGSYFLQSSERPRPSMAPARCRCSATSSCRCWHRPSCCSCSLPPSTRLANSGWRSFLTGGGPARATELISIYIYSESFAYYQLGYGAAVGVIMLSLSVVLGILYIRVLGRQDMTQLRSWL